MKKVVMLAAFGGLLALAAVLPDPPPPQEPTFSGPETPDVGAEARGSVWYCVWQESGDIRDATYNLASIPATEATITLPSPLPAQPPDSAAFTLPSPGARILNVAEVVRLGPAPGFIEYDDGPAGTSTAMTAVDLLTGDRCVRSVSRLWQLPGGTTRDGTTMTLRIFNPFPELAKVTVTGTSEFGTEPLPDLTAIDVAGRSWRDFDLNPIVPFLDDLVLTVSTEEGVVIPSVVVRQGEDDEASWPGTGLASNWYFPVARQEELIPELVVWNPGAASISVEVDAYTVDGPVPGVAAFDVEGGVPMRVPLDDVAEGGFGIHVRATGSVSAVVVATSPTDVLVVEETPPDDASTDEPTGELVTEVVRTGGTIGSSELAAKWLLPGAGSAPDAASTLWIMNPNPEAVTATLQPLGVRALQPSKLQVEPGTLLQVPLDEEPQVGGYLVESTLPVAVAWSAHAPRGIAYFAGISIGDEAGG